MKILYLHQYFKFPFESGGTRSYDLAKCFYENNYEVIIITSTSNPEYKKNNRWIVIEKEGFIIHYLYLPYGNDKSYFNRTIVFLKFLVYSTCRLLKIKGDVVLATSTPLTIGIPALVKKIIHKTPFIFEVRDVWPEAVIAIGAIKNKLMQKFLYRVERLIYKNAFAIIPLSVDMKQSIISRYPQFTKKLFVIENISEVVRFQGGYDSNYSLLIEKIGYIPRFSILYAGTFGKVNGIDYVIKFAERLLYYDETIVFILLGNGSEKQSIINLAAEKKVLNKNVFILESIPKKDLPQLYYEVNIGSSFVINIKELWANSANKFFDTLAAGKPVLINYKGWQKKVIEDDNLGFVLPPVITDRAIVDFIDYTKNTSLLCIHKKNALEKAEKDYSLKRAMQKYIGVLKKIENV